MKAITFTFERVANMVFLTSECGVIFNTWHVEDFTPRKRSNAIAKIKATYNGAVVFVFNA